MIQTQETRINHHLDKTWPVKRPVPADAPLSTGASAAWISRIDRPFHPFSKDLAITAMSGGCLNDGTDIFILTVKDIPWKEPCRKHNLHFIDNTFHDSQGRTGCLVQFSSISDITGNSPGPA